MDRRFGISWVVNRKEEGVKSDDELGVSVFDPNGRYY